MEQENKAYYDQIYNHPIFSGAPAAEFGAFMEKCTINTYEISERILYSQSPRNGLLLILKGIAEVYVAFHETNNNYEVLEVLERGEIIGFSSLADFLGEPAHYEYPYTVEVRAVEDAVCLHIPYSVMEARWTEEEVRDYVLRQVSVRLRDIYASLAEQVHLANQWGESDPFIQRVQDMMTAPAVKVTSQTPIAEVAEKMVKENASSVIVENEQKHLAGIITEKDLVQRVVAFSKDGKTTAAEIMSKNPYIITRQAYYYEAMSSFFMNGVKHLPVAEEDDHKKIIGMITLSDLLKKKSREV
ncbi:CBS domain-containing protein [Alteribacillus bidgolensis]|uniref:CBS domain-containing protein n=1 Tax=Alteribacillus bidgolensis TaxID=930129 RepID=A0A1G8M647_9BACI|nr:CBS domain-containing protein [Alteribacillus bidgolensis]SDI62840.1 CBS domain-containing protein [Alteribacillus bidgolensis]